MTRQEAKELALKHCKPFLRHSFESWILPVIHNMAAPPHELIDDIMAVQPMSLPSSQVFYMYIVYNSRWERFKRWIKSWLRTFRRRRLCRACNICGYSRCEHLEAGYGVR